MMVDNEECLGCGWTLTEDMHIHLVSVWNADTGKDEKWQICEPCSHAFHSWRSGKALDHYRAHISNCTNLILRALRERTG